MPDLLTFGETMVAFLPERSGALRYVERYGKSLAGAESNVAIGMTKLGHSSMWVSRVGQDEFGNYLLRDLRGEGVDVSHVLIDPKRPTGILFKQFSQGNETTVFYYRKGSAASAFSSEDLPEALLKQTRMVHLTGITPALSSSCRSATLAIAKKCKALQIPVSFDPNIRLKLWSEEDAKTYLSQLLPLADIVELGADEGKLLLGTEDPRELFIRLESLGVTKVAVKRGAKGAVVWSKDGIYEIPPYPIPVVDPVGAGDAFTAGFLSGILEKKSLDVCGTMGCLMGAMAIGGHGDTQSLPDREGFDRLLYQQTEIFR